MLIQATCQDIPFRVTFRAFPTQTSLTRQSIARRRVRPCLRAPKRRYVTSQTDETIQALPPHGATTCQVTPHQRGEPPFRATVRCHSAQCDYPARYPTTFPSVTQHHDYPGLPRSDDPTQSRPTCRSDIMPSHQDLPRRPIRVRLARSIQSRPSLPDATLRASPQQRKVTLRTNPSRYIVTILHAHRRQIPKRHTAQTLVVTMRHNRPDLTPQWDFPSRVIIDLTPHRAPTR